LVFGLLVESERAILFLGVAVSRGRSNPTDELDAPDLATEDGAESDKRFLRVLVTSCIWPNAAEEFVEALVAEGLMFSSPSNAS
jgi:hypothetical protein